MRIAAPQLTALVWTPEQKAKLEAKNFSTEFASNMWVGEASDEEKAAAKDMDEQRKIANDPSRQLLGVVADNDSRNLWGEIVKDGKIVARIYNSGGVETEHSNVHLTSEPSASKRAGQLLDQLGGELVMANVRRNYYMSHHLVPTCDWLGVVW